MKAKWVPHDVRDSVVDLVRMLAALTEIASEQIVSWLDIGRSKFYNWKSRYGKVNEHNREIPRDHWLEAWEKNAILDFYALYPLEGYRRLTFMMLDRNVVAVSPSSTYRVLKQAGLLARWNRKSSMKGKGFVQPSAPHQHWHVDVAYINLAGTFYYLCSILDGYSRAIVHWELKESMTERHIEVVLERAREKNREAKPRIISDNGPQFIAKDFKEYIRLTGMSHVRTSPYYPQSNGKIERWHHSLKSEALRDASPQTKTEAERIVSRYVEHYNGVRLHSAIGYVTPNDKFIGAEKEIFESRDRKLELARQRRAQARSAKRHSIVAEPVLSISG